VSAAFSHILGNRPGNFAVSLPISIDENWMTAASGLAHLCYLCMLDPIQSHPLQLCLGAFRKSPALANERALELCGQTQRK